jgi:hypothetical protein
MLSSSEPGTAPVAVLSLHPTDERPGPESTSSARFPQR